MNRTLLDALAKLLDTKQPLPRSQFSKKQQDELEAFVRQTGLVTKQPKGAGWCYAMTDYHSVEKIYVSERPQLKSDALPESVRALNLARYRNTKTGSSSHNIFHLLLKSEKDTACWSNGSIQLDLQSHTKYYGLAALSVQPGDSWISNQPLWLIENAELFHNTNWLPESFEGSLALYNGQLPNVFLDWLSQNRVPSVIHFPDYDGVGFANFLRLKQQLKDITPCEFWCMPSWKEKLLRFGNAELWTKNREDCERSWLRLEKSGWLSQEMKPLLLDMQISGLALEQEAVFL